MLWMIKIIFLSQCRLWSRDGSCSFLCMRGLWRSEWELRDIQALVFLLLHASPWDSKQRRTGGIWRGRCLPNHSRRFILLRHQLGSLGWVTRHRSVRLILAWLIGVINHDFIIFLNSHLISFLNCSFLRLQSLSTVRVCLFSLQVFNGCMGVEGLSWASVLPR